MTCPRCGPEFGLILLADRIEDRRVVEGRLGCSNCREQYPVRAGTVDARPVAERTAGASPEPPADPEAAVRLAALMGLAGANGNILVVGPGAAQGAGIAALVPEVEVIAVTGAPSEGAAGRVTRVIAADRLPFRSGTLRGAALTGGADDAALEEGLRVLSPGARLVVEGAAPGTAERLGAMGAEVILDQEGTVVARAPGRPVQLRLNALR